MLKRTLLFFTVLVLILLMFAGCADSSEDDGKIKIVSTVFPGYDFARQVFGNRASVTLLIPPGSESHTFDPAPGDIIDIEECDLFIYVGGESENWVRTLLSAANEPVNSIKMMDCVESLCSEEHDHHHHDHGDECEEDTEYDEHVWTSPVNAEKIVQAIEEKACELDPKNAEEYSRNSSCYRKEILSIDTEFREFFEGLSSKTMVFGDRFPLLYFEKEYSLDCCSAFPGCTAETEPSPATLAELVDKIKENNISAVYYIELSNHVVADSIASAAGVKTALFHSCHNVTIDEMQLGETYCSLMRQNLETLKSTMK